MFHSNHIHVPRSGRPSALRTFVTSSSFRPPESKEPLRRGILFTTVASVLLLVGSILTWLGFNDVFGGKVSMTGPLLIALALLLLLLSMRQFLIARKRNNRQGRIELGSVGGGTVTAVVVGRDDGLGAVTVIMDTLHMEQDHMQRNYAEDYAPPSYSEVAQWQPQGQRRLSGRQPSLLEGEEPPPPYEEAVQALGSPSSSLHSPLPPSSDHPDRHSLTLAISPHPSLYALYAPPRTMLCPPYSTHRSYDGGMV